LARDAPQFRCHFCDRGFLLAGRRYQPCHVRYHPKCLRIGAPFTSRLEGDKGLTCPPGAETWHGFICEACRVRACAHRELQRTAEDVATLMLERATIVDTFNHWSRGTLSTYKSKAKVLRDFETDFGYSVLPRPRMSHPPDGLSRPLMWAQQRYSLYPARWRRHQDGPEATIKFGTIRGLRSAAALQNTLNWIQSQPHHVTVGYKNQPTGVSVCNPTDEMAYTFFTDGMRRRLGDESNPSAALLDQHVAWIDRHFNDVYATTLDPIVKVNACRAAVTTLLAWLAWLRAVETFSARWGGLAVVRPDLGPQEGLPLGMGIIKLDLPDQTKSCQTRVVDMILAYTTASGKSLGLWLERLGDLLPPEMLTPDSYIICHADGSPWTSHYFRYTHLYPLLCLQRSLGDQYLSKFDESPGKGLIQNFWSFNMFRRGARGQVSRKRPSNIRKATYAEVIEHGRWKVSRSSLDMPTAYLEWSNADRVTITYFCM
jgi:hypothetical protein